MILFIIHDYAIENLMKVLKNKFSIKHKINLKFRLRIKYKLNCI